MPLRQIGIGEQGGQRHRKKLAAVVLVINLGSKRGEGRFEGAEETLQITHKEAPAGILSQRGVQ